MGFGGVSQSVRAGFRKRGRRRTFEAEREAQTEGLEAKTNLDFFFLLLIYFVNILGGILIF